MQWHALDTGNVCAYFSVDPAQGLDSADSAERLAAQGANELQETGGVSPWRLLWDQFTSTMALILTAAAIISLGIGSVRDAMTILAIVCLFALLGFVQEYKAERSLRALKRLAVPTVRVRRDGAVSEISAGSLVSGDVILLEAGNIIPADCRLLETYSLKVQESLLTGETEAVEKQSDPLADDNPPIADRVNMAWMGTTVSAGRAEALVVATGMATELGRIAGMLQSVNKEWTPLQKRLDRLGKVLAVLAVAIAAVVFGLGIWRGEPLRDMLMTAVSLAVAAIPEGLPAVVTITLAMGAQRMLKRHALIRKLPAVETLGSVTVICTDKTGTLTQNRMTVTALISFGVLGKSADSDDTGLLRMASVLCNDAMLSSPDGQETVVGDPTEGALLLEASGHGLFRPELEKNFPRVAEIPFDSAVKRMLTIHAVNDSGREHSLIQALGMMAGDRLIFAKGAPDAIMPICVHDSALTAVVSRRVDALAAQGQRVLAVAYRLVRAHEQLDLDDCQQGLSLLGLVAMMDPPRSEAHDAVARCLKAGIRPVMITGDHPLTARTIAEQVGILSEGGVLIGRELDELGKRGLFGRAGEVSVYSRVSPEHKLLIVQALQERGEVVAMTGDGVNDAPALKKADIGVAMGMTGTDVAKEASDMVLLDDNFATIVEAVEEGRTIYDNIRKFIEFSVAGNLGKILAVLLLPFLGLPNPLTPLQLLWLNLLTDGLLGLGMGVECPEPDVMNRPPISPTSQIFDRRMIRHTLLTGGVIGMYTILLTRHYWVSHPSGTWQTVLFTSLAFAQIGQAMALRSFNQSFFRMGFFSNPVLLAMVCAVLALQSLVVYLPVLQPVFRTVPLSPETLGWVILPGIVVFAVLEIEKLVTGPRLLRSKITRG
ncbi:MAG: cation-translocating P-type ATPase [Desulfuromonadales bacterium]|nr:cation-translocating P-type ATPase [Desulfuromonadales bacterium]